MSGRPGRGANVAEFLGHRLADGTAPAEAPPAPRRVPTGTDLTPLQRFHAVSAITGYVIGTATDLGQEPPEAVVQGSVTREAFLADAAEQWQGWGTALKPAWEPICLARKPLAAGTVAAA